EEFNDFITICPIPSEYRVILPKSNKTIFDAPPTFIYLGLTLLVVPSSPLLLSCARLMVVSPLSTSSEGSSICVELEHSSSFSTGSPYVSVNTKPLKANEELVIQPVEVTADSKESPKLELLVFHPRSVAAWIKDIKCKTRGGSSRPPVKRKLAHGSSTSRATRAKTSSSSTDDVPYLTMSDDDEGLFDVLELKDATACHLKIFAITLPAWKNHLDNHMDVELLDLHDRCYARQAIINNDANRRSCELFHVIEKLRGESDVMKDKERAKEEECEELQAKCEAAITEFEKNPTKWEGYQQSLLTLESKVTSLEAEKARLEGVELSLQKEVEELKQDRREAYEQVADMKEPFDLSKVKRYRSSYKKDHTHANNDLATATFP
nr:hypothetical protein [Tanacetum cinerariifolium]